MFDSCVFSLFVPAGCLLPDRRRHQGNGWGRWEAVLRSDSGLHARPVLWKKRCPHLADPHPVQSKRPVWSWDIHCWYVMQTPTLNMHILTKPVKQSEDCLLYVVRPRGGAAQKNGVPRVCVPRPVGILQVAEFSVPDHSNPAGKGLRLEPPRRRTGPYSQRVCQWQHLVT